MLTGNSIFAVVPANFWPRVLMPEHGHKDANCGLPTSTHLGQNLSLVLESSQLITLGSTYHRLKQVDKELTSSPPQTWEP